MVNHWAKIDARSRSICANTPSYVRLPAFITTVEQTTTENQKVLKDAGVMGKLEGRYLSVEITVGKLEDILLLEWVEKISLNFRLL